MAQKVLFYRSWWWYRLHSLVNARLRRLFVKLYFVYIKISFGHVGPSSGVCIMRHDAWRPEQRSKSRHSLLGNDSVNRFPRQRISKQKSRYCWAITMENMFSVGSAQRLYNDDSRPAGLIIEGVSWDGNRRWLRRNGNEFSLWFESEPVKRRIYMWYLECSIQWDWYNYCVKIRCQDTTTNEDWEP
jgi:hypothetical protein